MFSPSLISVMFHTFDPEVRFLLPQASFPTSKEIAEALDWLAKNFPSHHRTVPTVGRTRRSAKDFGEYFFNVPDEPENVTMDQGDPILMFWGRLPLDWLIRYFSQYHNTEESFEFLDLGTPLFTLGSGSSHDQVCRRLLSNSAAPRSATVGAAIVDMGEEDPGKAPDDYGGKLRHVVMKDIKLSDHAKKVLSILLGRLRANQLQTNSVLSLTTVSCALVRPPTGFVGTGLPAFDQACTPEMLTAIKALEPQLTADGLPAAVNMSLGTHVGPHNGESPLEQYIATTLTKKDRYLVVAAGNEGGAGHSAKCTLEVAEPDFLNIKTGPLCNELLVEFWWEDPGSVDLNIEVDIWETVISGGTVSRQNHGTLLIDSGTAGTLLKAPAGLPSSMVMHSLFSARCQKNFSCAAFAISSTAGTNLPALRIYLQLLAKRRVAVNGWIVVAEADPLTASTGFVESGVEGNITVPASDPTVLSVAGIDTSGSVWKGSSRGPAAEYDTAKPRTDSPLMAHLSHLGVAFGTSFASPRACGDFVKTLADPTKRGKYTNTQSLLSETYNLSTPLPAWNSRFGYHKQKT